MAPGSVIASWLLDLAAEALAGDPELRDYSDKVADSGEDRWTIQAAVDLGVPAGVLAQALFGRLRSRGEADYGNRVLSAMRQSATPATPGTPKGERRAQLGLAGAVRHHRRPGAD